MSNASPVVRAMNAVAAPSYEAPSLRVLRLSPVCEVTGFCRSMIYQMEAELRFPRRVKIGTRAARRNRKSRGACMESQNPHAFGRSSRQ